MTNVDSVLKKKRINNKKGFFLNPFYLFLAIVIGVFAGSAYLFAFNGPGVRNAGSGDPDFWRLNGTKIYYTGGNVGIGTSDPQALLDINGAIAISGNVGDSGQVLKSQGAGQSVVWGEAEGGVNGITSLDTTETTSYSKNYTSQSDWTAGTLSDTDATAQAGSLKLSSTSGSMPSGTGISTVDNGDGTWTTTIKGPSNTGDTYVVAQNNYSGSCVDERMSTGGDNDGWTYRALIRFDASSIPSDVTVTNAVVKLYLYSFPSSFTTWLQKADSSWDWNCTNYVSWGSQPSGGEEMTSFGASAFGWYDYPLTTSVAQGWVTSPSSNYGVKIRDNQEGAHIAYYPSWYTSNKSDSAYHPQLVITYNAPITYSSSGTWNKIYDAGSATTVDWTTYSFDATEPSNTNIKIRCRSASSEGGLSGASYGSWLDASSGTLDCPNNRYLEVQTYLETTQSATSPTLNSLTVNYTKSGPANFIGIGTTNPGEKLSVAGKIESTSGGFKFPDATTQTTAALSSPMILVTEQDLSSATSLTVSDLNGDAAKIYKIYLQGKVAAGTGRIYVTPNNATGDTYTSLRAKVYNNAGSASSWENSIDSVSGIVIGFNEWSEAGEVDLETTLYAISGRKRIAQSTALYSRDGYTNYHQLNLYHGIWHNTSSNITSLVFNFGTAFTGKLQIYKLSN